MGTKNLLQLSPAKKETIQSANVRSILQIMAEITKKKTFSMVAGICSFVVGAMALIYAIYELVYGIQAFGGDYDKHVAVGIFDLLECVILVGIAGVGVLFGFKLLAGSKLDASTNPIFNAWFVYMAGLYEINVIFSAIENLILGRDNAYWIGYLVVASLFLIGTIVMMFVSKTQSGLNSSIFFFVGIGCMLVADGYGINKWWVGVLYGLSFLAIEVMAVLARIFEDNLGR